MPNTSELQFQFNSDSSVMGTDNVATRIEEAVRAKLARFEERLTRIEVHVSDENAHKGGADDKTCMIEVRPRGDKPIGVTEHASDVDTAARRAANTMAQRLERVLGKAQKHKHDPRPDKAL
ncbi:MAG: HPF/RaiA family ribosome-associated protein [Marinomonas sp.]